MFTLNPLSRIWDPATCIDHTSPSFHIFHVAYKLYTSYIHIKSYPHLLVQSSTSSIFIDSRFNKKHHFPWQVHAPSPIQCQSKCGHLPCFCLTCCPWLLVSNPRMSASTPCCFISPVLRQYMAIPKKTVKSNLGSI